MAGKDQDLDDPSYDRLISFMESARYRMLQQQFTREAVEHLLIRLGFRMNGPDAHNEIQEQMAYLRRLWLMKPSLVDRVETLESKMIRVEQDQAEKFKALMSAINEKHGENKIVQESSAADRAAIKKDIEDTKRNGLLQLLLLAVAIIGALVMRYVLP